MAAKKQAVGVIGLGVIGSRVAANLRKVDYDVWVWSRSPRAEPNFLASPAEVAESAEVLELFVSDGAALRETVEAMLPALTARHIVLNHATVAPAEVKAAAEVAAKASAGFLDAPFTGSRDAAGRGELVYYVGGPVDLLDRVRPILEASAQKILELGEIGQASLVKIATNIITATTVEALAEAVALVDGAGVEPSKFAEALRFNASRSLTSDLKLPCMISADFDARFALKHMFKDMQLALAEAKGCGVELPACAATAAALAAAMHKGWAELDCSALANSYGFPGKHPGATLRAAAAGDASGDGRQPAPRRRFALFASKRDR